MTHEEGKQFILRYFAALEKDWRSGMEMYIADSDKELKDHIIALQGPFPGYTLTPEDIIVEGDRIVVRAIMHARHEGPFFGVPATHKEITCPGIIIYRVVNDKIVQHWMQFDMLGLSQEIGPAPTPVGAH